MQRTEKAVAPGKQQDPVAPVGHRQVGTESPEQSHDPQQPAFLSERVLRGHRFPYVTRNGRGPFLFPIWKVGVMQTPQYKNINNDDNMLNLTLTDVHLINNIYHVDRLLIIEVTTLGNHACIADFIP
jgi:hypothetical protein